MSQESVILGLSNIGLAVLFVLMSIPLLRGRVKMNHFYGVRFKKSFSSEENWYKINRYGARQLIIWSIPLFLIGIAAFFVDFGPRESASTGLVLAFASAPLIVLVPALMSWLYARKL